MEREVVGAAQQDGKPVARRVFGEVFGRNGSVFLQPLRGRKACKPRQQLVVHLIPCFLDLCRRWQLRNRLIGARNEDGVEFLTQPRADF